MEIFSKNTPDLPKDSATYDLRQSTPYTVAEPMATEPSLTSTQLSRTARAMRRMTRSRPQLLFPSRRRDRHISDLETRTGLDSFTPTNLELINYRKDGSPF